MSNTQWHEDQGIGAQVEQWLAKEKWLEALIVKAAIEWCRNPKHNARCDLEDAVMALEEHQSKGPT